MVRIAIVMATSCWIMLGVGAVGKAQSPSTSIRTSMTIHPTASPVPALRYALLPPTREIRPGNAAYLYQRAHSPEWFGILQRNKGYGEYQELLEGALEAMDRKRAERFSSLRGMYGEIDRAARSEYCDWGWLERIREDGIALLLPDLQGMRTFGGLVSVRTRLALADRKYDKAVHSLRTTFALSRHLADAPILINYLVGAAVGNMGLDRIEDWVQLPDAPNLYWALTDLPRPLLDIRKAVHGEKLMVDSLLPEIRKALDDPTHPPLTSEQILQRAKIFGELGMRPIEPVTLALMAARIYPDGRQYLLKRGRKEEEVDRLPVAQVALMYLLAEYDRVFDEVGKWTNLPYREARKGMGRAYRELQDKGSGGLYLARLLVPAMERIHEVQFRLDRRIALLRTVEALRLHAYSHEGKLPADLEDLRVVPIPVDPWTGRPFEYRREGTKVRLMGPSFLDNGGPADPYRIDLEIEVRTVASKR